MFRNSFDPSSDPLDPAAKATPVSNTNANVNPGESKTGAIGNYHSLHSTSHNTSVGNPSIGNGQFFSSKYCEGGADEGLQQPITSTNFNANRRTSVSAEALNPNTFSQDNWKPPVHQLSHDQLTRLNASVMKNFLFNQLDDESLRTIIFALEEKHYPTNYDIIKQGDEGDFFYVLEKGTVDYSVNGEVVNTSSDGSSFGELALMYNSPRAATVTTRTECIVWALDRMTFRRILLDGTSKKRKLYENFLKEVPVLQSLSSYERSKLADALNTRVFKVGENVVTQGEPGENFYFIEDGTADVISNGNVVAQLKKGDYFGELALLYDSPRQATVRASSPLKTVILNKNGFQRLLGPAVEVLKMSDPRKTH